MDFPGLVAEATALLHSVFQPGHPFPAMAEWILGTRCLFALFLGRLRFRHDGSALLEAVIPLKALQLSRGGVGKKAFQHPPDVPILPVQEHCSSRLKSFRQAPAGGNMVGVAHERKWPRPPSTPA